MCQTVSTLQRWRDHRSNLASPGVLEACFAGSLLACGQFACGGSVSDAPRAPPDAGGGSTGSGGAAGSGAGGSAGTTAGVGGSIGSAGSSGSNAGGSGATDAGERPIAPPWQPHFKLGTPGWRGSTEPLCTERFGLVGGPKIWSDAHSVFALVPVECNSMGGVACGGEGTSLYSNSGSGWAPLYRVDSGNSNSGLRGFPGGSLFFYANGCGITLVNRDGSAGCSWADSDFVGVRDLFTLESGSAYALIGDDQLLKYGSSDWSPFAELQLTSLSGAIWANEQAIVVAAYKQFVARGDSSGRFATLSNVPAGDYADAWVFGDDLWLANRVGHLVHFDGAVWKTIDTGINDEILGLWGSPDGMLYFYSPNDFGRWNGQKVELFARLDEQSSPFLFMDLWGNSSTEVFLGVRDNALRDFRCSGAFTLWFDGAEFHVF